MVLNKRIIRQLVKEELSKSDVTSLITSKLDSELSSSDFKKMIKGLAADVVSEMFKTLWQRDSMWKSTVIK